MADCGIEVSEEELMEMQQEFQPDGSALRGRQSQGTFESQHEEMDQEKPMTTAMDLIVTFGAPHQEDGSQGSKSRSQRAVTRQMQGVEFGSFDDILFITTKLCNTLHFRVDRCVKRKPQNTE